MDSVIAFDKERLVIRPMTRRHGFQIFPGLLLIAVAAAWALAQPATGPATAPATGPASAPATQPTSPWQADVAALDEPINLPVLERSDSRSFTRHLGIDIPRSLITLNVVHLPDGSDDITFDGTAGEYAAHLMSLHIDQLFEDAGRRPTIDLAQRLAGGRMRFGVSIAIPTPPRLAILPSWLFPWPQRDLNALIARDLQLTAQRLDDAGNFAGFVVTGTDRHAAAYLSDRLQEIVPHWRLTPGDFDGSNPRVSGEGLFSHLAVQQVHDRNVHRINMPLRGIGLIDRLRSYHPHKLTWAIIDNTENTISREALHRAYALMLTRGIDAIGPNRLPVPGQADGDQRIEHLREIHQWTQRLGGVYGTTEPIPTVGVLYVHEQARRDPDHERKISEAMVLCHAAGYPSRVITPEELKRGLPHAMKAVLLVGLDRADEQWAWHHGLEDALRAYTEAGGRFVIDEASIAPVPAIKPGVTIEAGLDQPAPDSIDVILERNRKNITRLREAMADVPRPIGYSDDPTLWAIPSLAGNVEYVTVVSTRTIQRADDIQENPDAPLPGGKVEWTSSRPVYDVRTRRKLSAEEARTVDLSDQGFHLYALPPVEPPPPSIQVEVDDQGCFIARVETGEVRGLPIEVTISRESASEKIYRATGEPFRLPLQIYDEPGEYAITVTELVTGQTGDIRVVVPANAPERQPTEELNHLAGFAARKDVPLVIALTDRQRADDQIVALANRLADHFRSIGRGVTIAAAAPVDDQGDGVVLPGGPSEGAPRPRWRTGPVDLVLLGTPRDNVLIRDQALGRLLPPRIEAPEICVTWSAFAPDHQVLNLLGDGAAALTVLIEQIERDAR